MSLRTKVHDFWTKIHHGYRKAMERWLPRLAFYGFLVCIILMHIGLELHIPQTIFLLLLTIVCYGIFEVSGATETSLQSLLAHAEAKKELKLNRFQDCMTLTGNLLANSPWEEEVAIDHLGLDMAVARFPTIQMIQHLEKKHLYYRLLVLSGDKSKLPSNAPQEVKIMADRVANSLNDIEQDLMNMDTYLKERGRQIRFSIKQYTDIPVVHGWSIRQPRAVRFLTLCRWIKTHRGWQYDWGANRYYHLDSLAMPPNSVLTDLGDVYDGYFNYLWDKGTRYQEFVLGVGAPGPEQQTAGGEGEEKSGTILPAGEVVHVRRSESAPESSRVEEAAPKPTEAASAVKQKAEEKK